MYRTLFSTALAMSASAAILLPSFLRAQVTFERTYGGADDDRGHSVQQTADGGYIITGYTMSFGTGLVNVLLIKTDVNGDTLWMRTYGVRDNIACGLSVAATADGGYIIAGYLGWNHSAPENVYLIKTTARGDTVWTKIFGGPYADWGSSVQQTPDGGYIIAGSTGWSSGDNESFYLVKTDAQSETLWTRAYGGAVDDEAYSIDLTKDGGYIIAGRTYLDDSTKFYLVKIDGDGDTLWTRRYGPAYAEGYSVQQTSDGGYIVVGDSARDEPAIYLVKTDADGDTLWTKTFRRLIGDEGRSVQQTTDGGYIIAGSTFDEANGLYDVWVIKTDTAGDTLWTRRFGGIGDDRGNSVKQTADGGYVIAGWTGSSGKGYDVYLVKTDSLGNVAVVEPKTNPTRGHALALTCEPNPSSGTTTIRLSPFATSRSPLTLRMYDSQGRMVLSREVSTSSFPLSTSDLPSGAYFIRCDAAGEHATTRVVLQR